MNSIIFKPQILTKSQAQKLGTDVRLVDLLAAQERELFLVRNPSFRFKASPEIKSGEGNWVYYPWRQTAVHVLKQADFLELKTARNRNLITKEEQAKIVAAKIAISGLSVGNSIAVTLSMEGFTNFTLADFDELSVSNLNRLRSSLADLGLNKAIIAARQIYEINPYAEVRVLTQGLKSDSDLEEFFAGRQIIIDETDDVAMRLKIRQIAKKRKLPVVSAADNGYNAVVDIERFDLEPNRPIYHGKLKNFDIEHVGQMSFGEKFSLINAMVGVELVHSRMKQSLLEVGKTLYSWPQLAGAAQLSGAVMAFIVKQVLLGTKIKSGKYDVNLERVFEKDYDSKPKKTKRDKETKDFLARQKQMFK